MKFFPDQCRRRNGKQLITQTAVIARSREAKRNEGRRAIRVVTTTFGLGDQGC